MRLVRVVDSAVAWLWMEASAEARPRVGTVLRGGEDFAVDCGWEPDAEVYQYPKQQSLRAARGGGLTPMGLIGTVADFSDADAYRAVVRHSAKFGFEGASCIHPANVAVLNEEFSPKPEAVAYARRVVEGDKQAIAEGRGSWSLDGKMIDIPVVIRAQRLIARADRIAARGNV